jgi:CubicO group peptidase (beta-lactamase class C family)
MPLGDDVRLRLSDARTRALGIAMTMVLMAGACSARDCTRANTRLESKSADAATANAAASVASPAKLEELSAELEAIRVRYALPSLAAAAYRNDSLIAEVALGVRKVGAEVPITTTDTWHLGSCTKAMTATLIGMLVDDDRLNWNTKLDAIFDDWKIHPNFNSVTVAALLHHQAGLERSVPGPLWSKMWAAAEAGESPSVTREAVVRALLGLRVPRGPEFRYSNAGYMVLGAVLEHITHQSWEELITKRLFGPLHMASCGFGAPATNPAAIDQPWGHVWEEGRLTPVPPGVKADNPPSLGPAGTVHCNLHDWARFINMHLAGARGERTLLSPGTMGWLQTASTGTDYASGWSVSTQAWTGGPALHHAGSNTMFRASTWAAPAKRLVFMVATNVGTESSAQAINEAFGPLIKAFADEH